MIDYNEDGVTYQYFTETKKGMFIAMEFAKEGDMCQLLMRIPDTSDKIVLHFFKQLLDGLEYLHSIGLSHRNLSLMNLLIDENFNLKITDFSYSAPIKNL